jgi:hypothetical protein
VPTPGSSDPVPSVTRGPASDLIRSAIRADMEARIERVAMRLEAEAGQFPRHADMVGVLEEALTEVTGIVAAGLLARILEAPAVSA